MNPTPNTVHPHVDVKVTYKTKTPFLFCELEGQYNGKPITIAVIETPVGQSETITGLLNRMSVADSPERERATGPRLKEFWAATIRTSRLNIAPLFNQEHGATTDSFLLSWTPDTDVNPRLCGCTRSEIIFGRSPSLRPAHRDRTYR